jgi:predicted nucleic acid-binding protein
MSASNPLIVVDANVWLDNYLPHEHGRPVATEFLTSASAANATILYPASILKDVFYVVQNRLKTDARAQSGTLTKGDALAIREIAWSCIQNMRELGTAVGMDEADLWLACKYRRLHGDLEDNLVLAAAERVHADYLVTSDVQLIRKSTVPALTPADMVTYLKTRAELV